jgi:hypothetical protein
MSFYQGHNGTSNDKMLLTVIMLNVIMSRVITLNFIMPIVNLLLFYYVALCIMLNGMMPSVVLLNVIMSSVVTLNVVAPVDGSRQIHFSLRRYLLSFVLNEYLRNRGSSN